MYLPNTLWTWSFLLVAVFQAMISLGLEAYVFGQFELSLRGEARSSNPPSGALTIPTYLAVFIFGFLYQLVLVYDALRMKNTIQVIGLCIYNLGMLIYAGVQMDQVDEAVEALEDAAPPIGSHRGEGGGEPNIEPGTYAYLKPCLITVPCVLALGTALMSFVTWKLYNEFAWTIYKHISADLRLKRRYLVYQIYIALLKFDFFFFLGFTVQFLVVVRGETYEFALTIAALPITVLLILGAVFVVRRESHVGQSFIIFVQLAGMAYFVFKLIRMYASNEVIEYKPVRPSLTTFAVLTILLLLVTIAAAVACMVNFNKGLKPHIQNMRKNGRGDEAKDSYSYGGYGRSSVGGNAGAAEPYGNGQQHALGQVGSRMTID